MSDDIRLKWRDLIGEFILEFAEAELDVFRIFEDFGSEADIALALSKQFKARASDAITLIDRVVENSGSRTRSIRALNELIKLADEVRNLIAHNPLQMTLEGVLSGSNTHEIRSFRRFDKAITLEELESSFSQLVNWRGELFNGLSPVRHQTSWQRSKGERA